MMVGSFRYCQAHSPVCGLVIFRDPHKAPLWLHSRVSLLPPTALSLLRVVNVP